MFDFLFKYSPVVYEQGQWLWRSRPAGLVLFALAAIGVFILLLAYRRTTAALRPPWHIALIALRCVGLAILAFCLLEPALSVSTVVTQKSAVLVLVDDSESMAITDAPNAQSRTQQIAAWLGGETQPGMLARLQENFRVSTFRFGERVEPLPDAAQLKAKNKSTNIAQALAFAAQQAQQRALSGVILVTDGAASAGADPLQTARDLLASNVPLFTVGVGTKIANDVQIAKVSAMPAVLENDVVEVNALIQARGHAGKKVEVELREGGTVLQRQSVTLQEPSVRVSLPFAPPRPGFAQYTLAVPPQADEVVASNNRKSFLVNSHKRTARILYVEQISPWEFKFIQRALAGDPAVQLTALLQTGPEKYLRLGLRDAQELANGFPQSAAELFGYQALIFRNVPANFFSAEQLRLVHDFVDQRGGGFMMLGGMKSFSEGGYNNSPVAGLLPMELLPLMAADGRAIPPQFHEEFRFTPTAEYLNMPLLQLAPEPLANLKMWEALPMLQGYNPLGAAKPGAAILAVHPLHRPEAPRIVLATQRYGRGRTAALATGTTWLWQMQREHTDMTHERFWRQLLRWLSVQTPDPVTVELERESYSPGETVALHISVMDTIFSPQHNANVTVKITGPKQQATTLHAGADLSAEQTSASARYATNFAAEDEGLYQVEVLAHDRQGRYLGKAESAFFVEPLQAEMANPDVQTPLLQRLAEMTKGRYFPIAQAQDLPDALKIAQSSYSKLTEHEVWDAPIFFLAMALLLATEWYIRRARGLS